MAVAIEEIQHIVRIAQHWDGERIGSGDSADAQETPGKLVVSAVDPCGYRDEFGEDPVYGKVYMTLSPDGDRYFSVVLRDVTTTEALIMLRGVYRAIEYGAP